MVPVDKKSGRMLISSNQKNLTHLTAANNISGDGPYYYCPSLFFQLCTFFCSAMYPLVNSINPVKSQPIYTRLLTLLKDVCQQHQLQLQPSAIFLDYKIAIRNAVYSIFSDINAKGCLFHLTQSIWRIAQKEVYKVHARKTATFIN